MIPILVAIGAITILLARGKSKPVARKVPVFKVSPIPIPANLSPLVKLHRARISGVSPTTDLVDDAICEAVETGRVPLAIDLVSHYYPDSDPAPESEPSGPAPADPGETDEPEIEIIGPSPIDGFSDAEWDSIMRRASDNDDEPA